MVQRSKIVGLPPDVKQWVDSALVEGNFSDYEALADALKAKGFGISKSSLHRYGSAFETRMAAVKLATEQAEAIARAAPDEENAMSDALLRVVQEKIFTLLINTEVDPDKIGFGKLATLATDLAFASTNVKEYRSKVRAKVEAAAADVASTVKKHGLSDEAVDVIKRRILGITE